MLRSTLFSLDHLEPKFQGQAERYNNWYSTVHFTHGGEDYLVKLAITEGSLLGQSTHICVSHHPLALEQADDALVLHPSPGDVNWVDDHETIAFNRTDDEVVIEMGALKAICRADQRRIVSIHPRLSADLTFTPRGPVFYWGHDLGTLCAVTDGTRVSGAESLSDVRGTIVFDGQEMAVEGRGLFERVWFGQLSFFEIRVTDWLYAHFDELYVYLCRTESATGEGRPFHFETGEMYLLVGDDFMIAEAIEFSPERWLFLQEARRFVPLEQSVAVRTEKGVLRLRTRMAHYPQLIQPPTRLESLTIDGVPGWWALFFDAPVEVSGRFKYKDGRVIELENGRGINELIRISPL